METKSYERRCDECLAPRRNSRSVAPESVLSDLWGRRVHFTDKRGWAELQVPQSRGLTLGWVYLFKCESEMQQDHRDHWERIPLTQARKGKMISLILLSLHCQHPCLFSPEVAHRYSLINWYWPRNTTMTPQFGREPEENRNRIFLFRFSKHSFVPLVLPLLLQLQGKHALRYMHALMNCYLASLDFM